MPTTDSFQADVARVALEAARTHGFALAGGRALIAHGVVDRPTADVDLFTDRSEGVPAAAAVMADALVKAGFQVEEIPEETEIDDLFEGFQSDMAEFEVTDGVHVTRLQLARFDRGRMPVVMDIGPVLHLDDVIGMKVAAMANRAEPRDLVDVAAASTRFTRDQLLALAQQADPGLTDVEFAEAMGRLDRLDDSVFGLYGLTPADVAVLRRRFADWPR